MTESQASTAVRGFAVLAWSIKASFSRYIAGLPDGECEISADVRLLGSGVYGFPGIAVIDEDRFEWRSNAWLAFHGHGGLLSVYLHQPSITLDGGRGALTAETSGTANKRTHIADLTVVERSPGQVRLAPTLTLAGSGLFAGNYREGEPLDEMQIILQLHSSGQSPTGTDFASSTQIERR